MICKYCGAKIDPESEVCPKCGKRGNKREGGNGFWDIARGPVSESKPEPVILNESKSIKPYIPFAICGLLCILSIIVALIGIASSNSKIKTIRKTYDMQMAEQARQVSEENNNLQAQINQLADRLAELSSQPTRKEESLCILSSPTPETCNVGFQSREGFCLFCLRVEGKVASFCWEKQQQNGDWVTIIFDENNTNKELGLRLEESISDGTSKLAAIGLTPVSFGIYKCTAIGVNGAVQSATVDLIHGSIGDGDTSEAPSYVEAPISPAPSVDESPANVDEDSFENADSNNGEKKGGQW